MLALRLVALAGTLLVLLPAGAPARTSDRLERSLDAEMRRGGRSAGAYVYDATARRVLYARRAGTSRPLASNAKLFTAAAVLGEIGHGTRLQTELVATAPVTSGVLQGDLFLRGGGDPTLRSQTFTGSFAQGGYIDDLAAALAASGVRHIAGGVIGDESRYDALRGSLEVGGALSALSVDRGLLTPALIQTDPPLTAARALRDALVRGGVSVTGPASTGRSPDGAQALAAVGSPRLVRVVDEMSTVSSNFLAEMLLKELGFRRRGAGSTAAGAAAARRYARRNRARVRLVDGSGISPRDEAAPREVVDLLRAHRARGPFVTSLPLAGREGTVRERMRRSPARGRCRVKSGTLPDSGVSALSGYCRTRRGRQVIFSFLSERIPKAGIEAAKDREDRMVQAIAGLR